MPGRFECLTGKFPHCHKGRRPEHRAEPCSDEEPVGSHPPGAGRVHGDGSTPRHEVGGDQDPRAAVDVRHRRVETTTAPGQPPQPLPNPPTAPSPQSVEQRVTRQGAGRPGKDERRPSQFTCCDQGTGRCEKSLAGHEWKQGVCHHDQCDEEIDRRRVTGQ